MRYDDESRERVYRQMDALRAQMAEEAVMAVYALNGVAIARATEHSERYFELLHEWQDFGRQLDAPPPGTGCA
jgi:predicted ATPase